MAERVVTEAATGCEGHPRSSTRELCHALGMSAGCRPVQGVSVCGALAQQPVCCRFGLRVILVAQFRYTCGSDVSDCGESFDSTSIKFPRETCKVTHVDSCGFYIIFGPMPVSCFFFEASRREGHWNGTRRGDRRDHLSQCMPHNSHCL